MKGSEFINLMRKVIREEVRTVVKEELKALKPLLMEKQQPTVTKKPTTPTARPQRTQPLVQFDGPLKSILEETARSMQQAPQEEEWPEMNMGMMTSEDVPSFAGKSNMRAAMSNDPTAVFIKDYSQVLKTAEQIASNNYRS
jgi:hypothetical protein